MDKKFINIITRNSFEVIKSAGFTKKDEFIDINDNKIAEGIPYHIHRTRDKQEFYMTSAQHETNSILIFKEKGGLSDFYRYKSLIDKKHQQYQLKLIMKMDLLLCILLDKPMMKMQKYSKLVKMILNYKHHFMKKLH